MVDVPWTEDEFDIILQNPGRGAREFGRLVTSKTSGAIAGVRSGIHSYHLGVSGFILTEMMLKKLMRARGSWVCPVCGAQF